LYHVIDIKLLTIDKGENWSYVHEQYIIWRGSI